MRQTFIAFLFVVVSTFATLIAPTPSLASGTTTTSTQKGQVIIRDENGVMYLTNTTNGVATVSATRRLFGTRLLIPTGFAKDLAQWINAVLSLVMVVAGLLVLVYLIWGAFDWLTSGGDKGKIDAARQKMTAAVVGIIIVSASYAILLLVLTFLGFKSVDEVFESVVTLDNNRQAFEVLPGTPSPTPSGTPSPSATPVYTDNLGELMAR